MAPGISWILVVTLVVTKSFSREALDFAMASPSSSSVP